MTHDGLGAVVIESAIVILHHVKYQGDMVMCVLRVRKGLKLEYGSITLREIYISMVHPVVWKSPKVFGPMNVPL